MSGCANEIGLQQTTQKVYQKWLELLLQVSFSRGTFREAAKAWNTVQQDMQCIVMG